MIDTKEKALNDFIGQFPSAMVAFSGGLDSATVLYATIKILGTENTLAVTSVSPSLAADEEKATSQIAAEIGLPAERHLFIRTDEISDPRYVKNAPDRCYYCKGELYSKLSQLAVEKGTAVIFDGTNLSDLGDYRPGRKAAEEHKVVSPFVTAGFAKEDVRALARKYRLSFSEKPAAACLASRIPYGISVTPERLRQIDAAESRLRALGLNGFRVRYHHDVARLELQPQDIAKIFGNGLHQKIIKAVKEAGFKYVAVDLEGYRQGSLNEGLSIKES